ncbi:hypothetical protein K3495_g7104, partial [Podosphaera aphanis]
MEPPKTPNRPPGQIDTDFTREDDENNLNKRKQKRRKDENTLPPVAHGGSASNTTDLHLHAELRKEFEAIDDEARIQREAILDLASAIDSSAAKYMKNGPKGKAYYKNYCQRAFEYLKLGIFAESNGEQYIPLRMRSNPTGAPVSISSQNKSSFCMKASARAVTFADIVQTPKITGKNPSRSVTSHSSSSSPSAAGAPIKPISGTESTKMKVPQATKSRTQPTKASAGDDTRILVTLTVCQLLSRPEPYVLRKALCQGLKELELHHIPSITATKTGWALHFSDNETRDWLFYDEQHRETVRRILEAKELKLPEKWHNYALCKVPLSFQALLPGTPRLEITPGEVSDEADTQTGVKPIDCRMSRHGPDPISGTATWIVSFAAPVRKFRLFGSSDESKIIDRKPPINRHDPGCQGYCTPAKCTRQSRCSHCGARTDTHEGPSGQNCTHSAQCANCF